jgi:ABC-type glycerol-3-phosphate transport system permease component
MPDNRNAQSHDSNKMLAATKASLELIQSEAQNLKIDELSFLARRKLQRKIRRHRRLSRSVGGDIVLGVILFSFGLFSAYPLLFTICNSLKPLDEIFIFPPKLFPKSFTLDNFADLFNLIGNSRIPFSRFLFNTVFITLAGTIGHVLIASLCAYPLAKHKFPGRTLVSTLVIYSLMFSSQVTSIPNYMIVSWLGLLDTPLAIIIPAIGYTLGLFLMKQNMEVIPVELLDAAKIDGASEYRIFWEIVMPLVKPAWLTLVVLLFQSLWGADGGSYIFTDALKPLSYALGQIVAGGIARTGAATAVSVVMLIVPITVFMISQSRIIDTMAHSGIK